MPRGPRPQPTAIKKARGNPGKRRLNRREPKVSAGLPACPAYLKGSAREAYQRFAEQLTESGVAQATDATALELLCSAIALYLDALAKVQEYGPVWMEKGDSKIPKFAYSPHWAVMNREWKKILSLLKEFGLTPSSRSSVQAAPPAAANPFAMFMKTASKP